MGFTTCMAQTFSYPKFIKQGKSIADLVPQNWKIIDTATGDLNDDNIDDLAMVIEYHLPITENRAYGDNETELIKEFQKPRVLAIFFRNKQTGNFVFSIQNNNFILRSKEGGTLGDPLREIAIQNKHLKLNFEGGNDWRWKLNYEFKFSQNDWKLMAAKNVYYHSETGELTEHQYNFSDRRAYSKKGNIFDLDNIIKAEEVIFFSGLKTFNTFKKPWTWEISKDNFL